MCQQLQLSERLLQAAIELFEQIGNLQWLANAVDELGLTLLQAGETDQAITTFLQALTILVGVPVSSTYQRSEITQHLQTALRTLA